MRTVHNKGFCWFCGKPTDNYVELGDYGELVYYLCDDPKCEVEFKRFAM